MTECGEGWSALVAYFAGDPYRGRQILVMEFRREGCWGTAENTAERSIA